MIFKHSYRSISVCTYMGNSYRDKKKTKVGKEGALYFGVIYLPLLQQSGMFLYSERINA